MNILLINNKYLQFGGEEASFKNETELLERTHNVKIAIFDNQYIDKDRNRFQIFFNSIFNYESYREIEKIILDFNPDVIHVHNIYYMVSPSVFFVARKYNVPIVLTVHNYRLVCSGAYLLRDSQICEICVNKVFPLHGIVHKCNRESYSQSFALTAITGFHKLIGTWQNRITKIIVLTDFAKRRLLNSSLKLSADKIVVKPNSVEDLGYVSQNEREGFFLFVGRLSSEKGINVLIDAANQSTTKIKILGDGPLKELVVAASLENPNLEYLGFKDRSFIVEAMKSCKALIFPSIWYEGLPLTILESFSTGTPVICSDIDNLNEIVVDRVTGLSFKNGDAISLSETLDYFNSNSSEMSNLYGNCRQEFLEKYSQEVNYHNLLSIYESLILK